MTERRRRLWLRKVGRGKESINLGLSLVGRPGHQLEGRPHTAASAQVVAYALELREPRAGG
eukprot:1491480-Lingulodinium_polyedra.AAC.1